MRLQLLAFMAFTMAPMLVDCQVRESTMELYDMFHDPTTVPSVGGYVLFKSDPAFCGTDGTMKLMHNNANQVQKTICSKHQAEDIEFRIDIKDTTLLGSYTAVGAQISKPFVLFRSCNNCSKCDIGKFCLAMVQEDDNGCKPIDSNRCPQKTSDYIVHPAKELTLCHAIVTDNYDSKALYWYDGQQEIGDKLFMAQQNGEKLRINDVVIAKTGKEFVQMICPNGSKFADSTYSCEFIEEGGRKHSEKVEKTCNENAIISIPTELFKKGGPRMVKGNCTVKKGAETAFTTFRIAIMKAPLLISYNAATNETMCSTEEKLGSLFSSSGKKIVDKTEKIVAFGSGPTGPKMKGHAGAGAKCIWNVECETCDPVRRAKHAIESKGLKGMLHAVNAVKQTVVPTTDENSPPLAVVITLFVLVSIIIVATIFYILALNLNFFRKFVPEFMLPQMPNTKEVAPTDPIEQLAPAPNQPPAPAPGGPAPVQPKFHQGKLDRKDGTKKGPKKSGPKKSQGGSLMKADHVDVEAGKGAPSRGVQSNSTKQGKSGMKKQ